MSSPQTPTDGEAGASPPVEQDDQQQAVVTTADGTEHTGVLPASAAVDQPEQNRHREGWFRSPSGHPVHADGPSQYRTLAERGYEPIDEDQAQQLVADGATLETDGSRDGNFDAESVQKAVKEESTRSARRRRG